MSLAVFPTTMFMRMAYTESTLLFLLLVGMYGIRRKWNPLYVAMVFGAASGTRAVGAAGVVPLLMYWWECMEAVAGKESISYGIVGQAFRMPRIRETLLFGPVLIIVAWSGLLGFMAYQAYRFGNPGAFAEAQMEFRLRSPPVGVRAQLRSLVTAEPMRSTYTSGSACYWGNVAPRHDPLVSLSFANPVYFGGAIILLIAGFRKGWITNGEAALSVALIVIPYISQSGRWCTVSQGRFASVVFPVYIVIGRIMAGLPFFVTVPLLLLAIGLLASYAALFSSWYVLL
jgi:hypothetical protein